MKLLKIQAGRSFGEAHLLTASEPKRGRSQGLAKQAAERAKRLDGRRSEGYRIMVFRPEPGRPGR